MKHFKTLILFRNFILHFTIWVLEMCTFITLANSNKCPLILFYFISIVLNCCERGFKINAYTHFSIYKLTNTYYDNAVQKKKKKRRTELALDTSEFFFCLLF